MEFKNKIRMLGAFKNVTVCGNKWTAKAAVYYSQPVEVDDKNGKKKTVFIPVKNWIENDASSIFVANKELTVLRKVNKKDLKKSIVLFWDHLPEKIITVNGSEFDNKSDSELEAVAKEALIKFNLPKTN